MTTRKRVKTEHTATQRLKKDYLRLKSEKLPYITAVPDSQNILEWHYVLYGPEDTPFSGGYYHGVIRFPSDFPFRAPSLWFITPNGRFRTHTKLCLSNRSVSTILTGLLSFMLETSPTYGSMNSSDAYKLRLAKESLRFNINDEQFCLFFPEIAEEIKEKLDNEEKSGIISANDSKVNNESTSHRRFDIKKIMSSVVLDLILIIGFVIVIFLCKYVINMAS